MMSFPRLVIFDCIMTLAILESKVADLANALFNVQVERQGHAWSLTYPGGIKIVSSCEQQGHVWTFTSPGGTAVGIVSSSELVVKGAPDDTILEDIFGSKISTAVVTSTMRGVSMVFPAEVSETVVINLTLETFRAMEIRKKIFPRM
jgi:hypothetical protein